MKDYLLINRNKGFSKFRFKDEVNQDYNQFNPSKNCLVRFIRA